jgi:site-specific recombinase XerD
MAGPVCAKCEYVFYNPDVTSQTFRHTFASRLTRNGADLVTVKKLPGHSSGSVTMCYAHTNRDAKRQAVRLVAGNGAKISDTPSRAKIAW